MDATPKRSGALLRDAPTSQKLRLGQHNSRTGVAQVSTHVEACRHDTPRGLVQSSFIWSGWSREAARLFALYWRSGDLKHFQAFGRHCDAMRLMERPTR